MRITLQKKLQEFLNIMIHSKKKKNVRLWLIFEGK